MKARAVLASYLRKGKSLLPSFLKGTFLSKTKAPQYEPFSQDAEDPFPLQPTRNAADQKRCVQMIKKENDFCHSYFVQNWSKPYYKTWDLLADFLTHELSKLEFEILSLDSIQNGEWVVVIKLLKSTSHAYPILGKISHLSHLQNPTFLQNHFQVIIDPNQFTNQKRWKRKDLQFHKIKFSANQKWMGIIFGNVNSTLQCYLKNFETQQEILLQDEVMNLEFSQDSHYLYYTVLNDKKRPFQLRRLHLQLLTKEIIFTEMDASYFVDITKTKDAQYLILNLQNKTTSEVYWIDTLHQRQLVKQRCANFFYLSEHSQGKWFQLQFSNHIKECYISSDNQNWTLFWKWEGLESAFDDVDLFENFLVIYYSNRIQLISLADKQSTVIPLTSHHFTSSIQPCSNNDPQAKQIVFEFSSILGGKTIYQLYLETKQLQVLYKTPYATNFEQEYEIRQVQCPSSHDASIQIPLSIICKKSLSLDQKNPFLLLGYGSYGVNFDISFDIYRCFLLEQGINFAIAHVRGGGELGSSWHEEGKLVQKQNSMYDFIDAAEYLIQLGYTCSPLLAARGVSAGGLLVASAVNMKPQLFKAAILKVSFLDVLHTMQDESLPLTEHEFEEFGNPKEPSILQAMKQYCPYTNISPSSSTISYPNFYISAAMNDIMATYWSVLKYVMKLRWYQQTHNHQNRILFYCHQNGHVDLETYDTSLVAKEFTFILETLKPIQGQQ